MSIKSFCLGLIITLISLSLMKDGCARTVDPSEYSDGVNKSPIEQSSSDGNVRNVEPGSQVHMER